VREDAPVPRSTVRVLGPVDLEEAASLCAVDPVGNAFVASRLAGGLLGGGRQAEVWGYYDAGELVSLCWYGGNLVPVAVGEGDTADAFASRARRLGRRCSSIFGPSEGVMALWRRLRATWGEARDVRDDQPLMVCREPLVHPDPFVRVARRDELDLVLPAAVAMFTEEIGYSPVDGDGALLYRAGIAEIVELGRSFVRVDTGLAGPEVVFKAELGAVTPAVSQIQGVWVAPHRRGHGLSAPGVAAVVGAVVRGVSELASLYVNAYNDRAIRTYERVGFRMVGRYATVLF
jgi:hypothetical protein